MKRLLFHSRVSQRFYYRISATGSLEPNPQPVAPMAVNAIQVVGGTPAIPPSLLYTDSKNKGFLINGGEGIQRMILESPGLRIANITGVLTTRFAWNTVASIPGIGLFRRDQVAANATSNPLVVWGTDLVNGFMRSTQLDCFNEEIGMDRHIVLKDIKDLVKLGDITVKTISLVKSNCFMFFLPPKAESVNQKKLKNLNIPKKLLASLFKIGSVELEGGNVVNKSDVLNPSDPAPVFVVIDAQSVEECEKLLDYDFNKEISQKDHDLMLFVHFTDEEFLKSDSYKQFMKKFESIEHLIMCRNPVSRVLYDCAQKNAILSSILPTEKLSEPWLDDASSLSNVVQGFEANVTLSEHLLKYIMYPGRKTPVGWCKNNLLSGKSFKFEDEKETAKKTYDKFQSEKNSITRTQKRIKRSVTCPNITFLGTTSTYSSTYRNVSGVLLQSSQDEFSALLDAGEMTVGQLVRLYGTKKAEEIIGNLNFLYISHIHFDHIGGSVSVAEIYYKINNKPLTVLCPIRTLPWYKYVSSVFKIPLNLVPLGQIAQDKELRQSLKKDHGVSIGLCPAKHTRDSWCIALSSDYWKVSYSGDTMPNPQFVAIGKDSDVLIHEATHQSSLAEDAERKKHSTVQQAIQVGKDMNARYTVLTHFSLRYQKLPPIIDEELEDNVVFAHDFMKITENNIDTWCQSTAVLHLLFPEHYKDLMKNNYKHVVL